MDTIADMLIRIKNGYLSKAESVAIPHSKVKMILAKIMEKEGYIMAISEDGTNRNRSFKVILKYTDKAPSLSGVARISKPGLRVYAGKNDIPQVLSGLGISVISTSKGLMTGRDAKKLGLGGEIICKIW